MSPIEVKLQCSFQILQLEMPEAMSKDYDIYRVGIS